MEIFQIVNPEIVAQLFAGWRETMIWSYLHGCMGRAFADSSLTPRSARIDVGDFSFLAGLPLPALVSGKLPGGFRILVPQSSAWEACIRTVYPHAAKRTRYATKKDPAAFDLPGLAKLAASLPTGYTLCPMNSALYRQAQEQDWSKDLCGQFRDWMDYESRGIGTLVLCGGELAAGASSYTVYRGGIEIEIDTRADHRRKGLARCCGARLILDCLARGLYPSWDAHNPASLALAEQLGYRPDSAYAAYEIF